MTDKISQQAMLNRIKAVNDKGQVKPGQGQSQGQPVTSKSFEAVLQGIKDKSVVVSKHALERLASRNVAITESEMSQISEAMDQASVKGVRDAVIIMSDKVLVANVPNKTIITAARREDLNNQIITNINGAIVL